ncbi:MAG: phage terminase large subunit, partial [Clostridia bacterium]|nr:phage terminase large subunit [Clostridia bacterium]
MATRSKKKSRETVVRLDGKPSEKQAQFFASRARYTAYGGARGGGKSWALRRKLILLCFHYLGISCLLVRRTLPELRENHLFPLLSQLGDAVTYKESTHTFTFPGGSRLVLGYCDKERDVLRYQGQEYDIIALDEATQLTEFQFSTFKACLRGANSFPKRIYLTCNPGGVGHAWVKRLFVDRLYHIGEDPADYAFIPAGVYDNQVLLEKDPGYVSSLQSLPDTLKRAWLEGSWDVFEGQFFPEFSRQRHVCAPFEIPQNWRRFGGLDYGFDMLAVVWAAIDPQDGTIYIYRELGRSGLTLTSAAKAVAEYKEQNVDYLAASPDLWNRRQDTGLSGMAVMNSVQGVPILLKADDRRIMGWRNLREFLTPSGGETKDGKPRLQIFSTCTELIRNLPALLHDKHRPEDVSSEPHAVTHFPEALRYAL